MGNLASAIHGFIALAISLHSLNMRKLPLASSRLPSGVATLDNRRSVHSASHPFRLVPHLLLHYD